MAGDEAGDGDVELDAEARRLRLDAEKAKFRRARAEADQGVAEARAATWQSVVPAVDAPEGATTVGEGSGALGPWLAHRKLADAAGTIAAGVREEVDDHDGPRILVVDDLALLDAEADWLRVRQVLAQAEASSSALAARLRTAATAVDEAFPDRAGDPVAPDDGIVGVAPPDGARPPSAALPPVSGAIGAAIGIAQLLRTDQGLVASPVASSDSELAVLATAALVAVGIDAELDGFALTPDDADSPLLQRMNAIGAGLRRLAARRLALSGRLAPHVAELEALVVRRDRLDQALVEAMASTETADERVAGLRRDRDEAAAAVAARSGVIQPVVATVDDAGEVLDVLGDGVDALLAAPPDGIAPLLAALARERLHAADTEGGVSHVLYVATGELNSDVVTRSSLLGSSGRVGFIGSASTTWLLLDVAGNAVVAGGPVDAAGRATYDLAKGIADVADIPATSAALGSDPQGATQVLVWTTVLVAASAGFVIALFALLRFLFG